MNLGDNQDERLSLYVFFEEFKDQGMGGDTNSFVFVLRSLFEILVLRAMEQAGWLAVYCYTKTC